MFERDQLSGGGDVNPNFVSKHSEKKGKKNIQNIII